MRLGIVLWAIVLYILTTKPETMLIHLYCAISFILLCIFTYFFFSIKIDREKKEKQIEEEKERRRKAREAYKLTDEYKREQEIKAARERWRMEQAVRH